MRRFTRLALAALAAIGASGALWAAPAASWVNFGGGITNDDGTIKYYGGNTAYYITVSGGTRADDGSYIQVGAPASEDGATAATAGSITLTVPSAVLTSKTITIMAEVQYLSAEANTLIDLVVGSDAVRLKSTGTQLQQCWNDTANYGSCTWTPTNRQRVTFTYKAASNQGSHTYLGDTPTAAAMSATNLMTTGSNIGTITLGKAATGLKIYSLYVYTTKLASASEVTTEIASNKAALAVPLSFTFSRAGLPAEGNTMEVLQVGGGAAKASTFEAELDTNATRKTDGGGETDSSTFFKKETATPSSSLLTTNGYPMIACKFVTDAGSQRVDEGWCVYLRFTPSVAATVTRVCPQLFAVTSGGATQGDANKVFNYTVTLYEGTVNATTESPTALATATGTTGSLNQTLVNTQAADFTDKVTLNADTTYTMKLAVSASDTGGGSYSGIAGVVFSNVASRTVSGTTGNWSTAAEWDNRLVPTIVTPTTLNVSDAASLALDTSAFLPSLTVNDTATEGSASLTFTGTNSLSSATTTLNVNTDVSAITASLGAVTLAGGKTLTVKSLTQTASLSTSNATLVTTGDTALASGSTLLSGVTNLIVRGGTFSSSLSGASALATRRNITVTGAETNLLLAVKDGTGWNSAGPGIRVEDGGTLTFGVRDTLTTPITLCGGTLTCSANAADDGRALDFYNGSGNVINVEKAKTGTAEAPTTSYITVAGTGENARLAIRNGALTFNVADSAKLVVSANISPKCGGDGTAKAVTKSGDGVLELTAANTFDTGLTIAGGSVLVTGDGTLGTGAVTVNEGKTLEVQVADSVTKTIANTLSGAGTVKKSGAGTLSLTGTVSAPITVAAGTLQVGSAVSSAVTLENGAALDFGTGRSFALASVTMGTGNTIKVKRAENETVTTVAGTGLTSLDGVTVSVTNNDDTAMSDAVVALLDGTLTIRSASGTPTWTLNADGTTGSWNGELTGWPTSGTVVVDATALAKDATVALPASATFDELIVMGSSAKTTLTVDPSTTITTLSPSGYVAMAASDVNDCVRNTVSVAAGGIFEVTTDGTSTLSKAITGAGKFAKGGSGTLTLDANITITTEGGSIVQSGTLKFAASGNGTITTKDDPGNYTNNAMGDVRVCEDAVLDLNGRKDLWLRTITLETGATYKNGSSTEVTDSSRQLRAIVLEGDAFVEATANFGLVAGGYAETTLELNGHTLTKKGTANFWLGHTTATNGILVATNGKFSGSSASWGQSNATVSLSGVTLRCELAEGAAAGSGIDLSASTVTVPADAMLTTEVANGASATIPFNTLTLNGTLTANCDITTNALTTNGAKTLAGTGTVTVKEVSLGDALTVQQPLVFDRSAAATTNVANAVKVLSGGSLTTKGNITFASSACEFSGPLTVESGTTTWRHNGANKSISGNITVNAGATFATASDFKYHTTLNGSLSGAGTIRAKVATYSSQDDGTRYLYCNGNCDDFIGSLAVEVSTTKGGNNAPRRTNVVLKPGDGKFGGSLAVQLVTVGTDDTTLSTDAAADATVVDGVLAYAKAYITGNAAIRGAVDKNLTLVIGKTEEDRASASATTLAGTLGTVSGEGEAAKSTFSAPITVASGSSLTITSATPATLTGAVSGGDSLTIGDGTTATQITLAGTLGTVTDGSATVASPITIAANATLALASATPTELTTKVTGAGILTVDSGKVTLKGKLNEVSSTVESGATLVLDSGVGTADADKTFTDTDTDCRTVTNDGTLELATGYGYFKIGGTGTTKITGTGFLFGVSTTNQDSPFKNNLEVVASGTEKPNKFRIRPWMADHTLVIPTSAKIDGEVVKDEGGTSVTLQIPSGATLSGSGTINVPVAFENEATATMDPDANLTFTSALTVPQHVTLTGGVTLAAGAVLSGTGNLTGRVVINANAVIDATDSSVEEFLKLSGEQITLGKPLKVKVDGLTKVLNLPTTAGLTLDDVQETDDSELPTGAKFVLSSSFGADTLMLMVPPALPAAPAESPRDAGVDEAIAAAANALASAKFPVVVSEVTKITATGTDGTSSREINAASLFENVLTLNLVDPKPNGTWIATATVAYDFGVSQITVKKAQLDGDAAPQLYVLACAKVYNGKSEEATAAGYADGTTVSLLLDDTEATGAVALDTTTLSNKFGVSAGLGEQWFALPMAKLFPVNQETGAATTGTRPLKVKASKAADAN